MNNAAAIGESVSAFSGSSNGSIELFRSLFGLVKREDQSISERRTMARREGATQFINLWNGILRDYRVRETCEEGNLLLLHAPLSLACFYFCAEDGACCRIGPFFTEQPSREELRIRLQQEGIHTPEDVYPLLSSAKVKEEKEVDELAHVLQKILDRDLVVIDASDYRGQKANVSSDVHVLEQQKLCAAVAEQADLMIGKIFLHFQSGNEKEVRANAADFASLIRENAEHPQVLSTLRVYLQQEIAEILTYQYDKTHEKQSIFLLSECMDRIRWQSTAESMVRIQSDFLDQAMQMANSRNPESAPDDRRVRDLMDYIHVHYAEKLPLSQLAEITGLGASYLSSLFRRETGMTISSYIRKTRIGHAQLLLHYLNISVTEIAYQCGYQDVSYFIKDFRRETGYSPVEFRKNQNCGISVKSQRIYTKMVKQA